MARDSNSGWSRPWAAFFAVIIVLGGVAVSLGFGIRLRGALERNAVSRLAASSAAVQTTVTNELGRYADAVRLGAAAIAALPEPTAGAFRKIAAAVDAQGLTGVRSLSLVVTDSPGLTSRWRDRGAGGFTPKPGADLREHLYPVFTAGLAEHAAPPTGVDQGAAQAVVDVTHLATEENSVAVSDAYVRLADLDLPATDRALSFDVVAPIGSIGFAVLNVVARDLVTVGLALAAAGNDLDAQLLTRSGSGELAEVAAVVRSDGTGFRHTANFTTGERQWVLRTSATYQTLLPNAGRTDMVVVIAGATLATMFGILMYLQMSATARTEQEITLEVAERLDAAQGAREALLAGLLTPPGEGEEVDLGALVRSLDLAGTDVEDLPTVRGDAALLRRLVTTLVAEARSRIPADARLTVTAEGGRLRAGDGETTLSCPLPGMTPAEDPVRTSPLAE